MSPTLDSAFLSSPLFASGAVNLDLDLTMVAHLVLFTGFIMFMKSLVFDPLLRVFEERERRTTGAVDAARGMDEEAITLKAEVDEKLEGVRREAAADREKMRAHVGTLESQLATTSRDAANEKLEAGMAKIHREVDLIRGELDAQRADLAAEIASKVLGRTVTKGSA